MHIRILYKKQLKNGLNMLPQSEDFIEHLSPGLEKRIIDAGWDIEKSIFFTIPFVAGSPISSGIIRDYRNKIYYRTSIWTEGLIENLSMKQLRPIIEHEKYELSFVENNIRTGIVDKIPTISDEEDRHKSLMKPLYKKYGTSFTKRAINKAWKLANNKEKITRLVLGFWIQFNVIENYKNYMQYSLPMTSEMKSSEQRNLILEQNQIAINEYSHDQMPIKEFKTLLESIKSP